MGKELDFTSIDGLTTLGCKVLKNEPMKQRTSFKIGGAADRLVLVHSDEELKGALKAVRTSNLPVFILGNGSNILVSDKGIRGVVIKLVGDFEKIELLSDGLTIAAGSGALLANVCKFARDSELAGLEFAYGIPGTIGGGIFMNAGAYGGEMKDVAVKTEHVSLNGESGELSKDKLELSYRHSAYSDSDRIVTKVYLKLAHGKREEISEKMDELMQKRLSKQPYDLPSAGSTFKRPEGYFAAALIEECGLKGEKCGGAEVSEKHSGFIINTDNATCGDVLTLIDNVKQKVFTDKEVQLECEVRVVGEK